MNQNIFQDGIKHLLTVEPEFKRFVPNHDIDFFLRPDGFAGLQNHLASKKSQCHDWEQTF